MLPMTEEPDLIIAFAFSLTPDGAPGSYNRTLAQYLEILFAAYQDNSKGWPYLGVQWEIADALSTRNPSLIQALSDLGKLIVVEPPTFSANEVDEEKLVHSLGEKNSKNHKLLHRWLTNTPGRSITEQLNNVLKEEKFYEDFEKLDLANLTRPQLGYSFTEHRALPRSQDYPSGLGQYQRKRINRLVIERIVDDEQILQRGRYLSTTGVLDFILEHMPTPYRRVGIVAHPLHAPRCIEQSRSTISARVARANIYAEGPHKDIAWDNKTAQVWCRSLSNWNNYEKVVQKLISPQSFSPPTIPSGD